MFVRQGKKAISNYAIARKVRLISISSRIFQLQLQETSNTNEPFDWDRGARTNKTNLSPLYASMKRLMDQNPGCVSLIQVGSFYELYFDQAEIYGPKLGLKVATRKTSNHCIPMAGFPLSQLRKFVEVLVQEHNVNVAIVDQNSLKDKTIHNLIHRKISRIISPGTLIDESFLNFDKNNYLVAISFPPNMERLPPDPDMPVGLAWIDVSIGESLVQQTTLGDLVSDLSRIQPSEILISKTLQSSNLHTGKWYAPLQDLRRYFIRYHTIKYTDLKLQFKASVQATRKALEEFTPREEAAMNMILSYVSVNLPEANFSLELPTQYMNSDCLQMDARTRDALELTERAIGGRSSTIGTLLSTIKRTTTASGTRLLIQWIKSPVLDINEIERRQQYVEMFLYNPYLTTQTRHHLNAIGDFVRYAQRLSMGTGDVVHHLVSIADSLNKLEAFETFLKEEYDRNPEQLNVLRDFLKELYIPKDIANEVYETIYVEKPVDIEEEEIVMSELQQSESAETEGSITISDSGIANEPPVPVNLDLESVPERADSKDAYLNSFLAKYRIKEEDRLMPQFAFTINRNYNPELSQLHSELDLLETRESELIAKVKEDIHAIDPKIEVVKKETYGRYENILLISGKQKSIGQAYKILEHDIREHKKKLLIFKSNDWRALQHLIREKRDSITVIEQQIIEELKSKVIDQIPSIKAALKLVDFLDVTSSFSVLAKENHWVKPTLTTYPILAIENGRHVVVESSLQQSGTNFTPNNSTVGQNGKLWVISGPNMGGKSTYLRQNALMVILAQIGSYVPASSATIGIVDKIFTRIGASDDLFNDLSTFMVEMIETSNILQKATLQSLAIVDEIGRGTSGKEGIAIAYATLVELLRTNKCRTLFATHFGIELELMLKENGIDQSDVRYFRTRVLHNANPDNEFESPLIIDHALEEGISERSHALEIARMAGFPKLALDVAKRALDAMS